MVQAAPLEQHQQELVSVVRAAHQTLALARRTRSSELARRIAEAKIAAERVFDQLKESAQLDLDREITQHEVNLDDSLIAAYEGNVPVLQIALQGFGNRYPGGVQELVTKLRADGRIGSKTDYQRNTADAAESAVAFPEPVDVQALLAEHNTIAEPTFELLPEPIELVPGDPEWSVPGVVLTMDARDPYFGQIAPNARKNTPYLRATTATLYQHPATGNLMVVESKETGEVMWDHPVARWVKDHPDEAQVGFENALSATVA